MEKASAKTNSDITNIVWDADNTIWGWAEYAVPAYEAMAEVISAATGIPSDQVAEAMQNFYVKAGSIENEGLIQGLEEAGFFKNVKGYNEKFRKKLILKAQKAFSEARNTHLRLYPGIDAVFKKTHAAGIRNSILTDAPSLQASMRITQVELDPFIETVFARKKAEIPNLPPKFKNRKYDVSFKVVEIDGEKPNTNLEEILQMTREEIKKHVVIIGDNNEKDMELARKWDCRGIHTVYGSVDKDTLKRLLKFSPQAILRKNAAIQSPEEKRGPKDDRKISIAKRPSDILKILGLSRKK